MPLEARGFEFDGSRLMNLPFSYKLMIISLLALVGCSWERDVSQEGAEVRPMSESESDVWTEIVATAPGRERRMRFFATWTGYDYPPKPRRPVDLLEAQELEVYYEGTFEKIGKVEVLVQFDKFTLTKEDIDGLEIPPRLADKPLLAIEARSGSQPTRFSEMSPSDLLAASEYLYRPANLEADRAIHVTRTRTSSTKYAYDENGKFSHLVD